MRRVKMAVSIMLKKFILRYKIYRLGETLRKRKTTVTLLFCVGGCFVILLLFSIANLRDSNSNTEGENSRHPSHINGKSNNNNDHIKGNLKKSLPIKETPTSETPLKVAFIPKVKNNLSQSVSSILVLSSVGRSGSSFLGELLAAQENNFYIYEPLRALKKGTLRKELVQEELIKSFRCQISSRFLSLENNAHISIKHPYTMGKSRRSLTLDGLKRACENEPLKIVKTIRTRLEWTKRLLEEKDLNLKVLHLVRDPRGSYTSMDSLKWKVSVEDMCHRLTTDLKLKEEMERLYPGRYFFIRYEDLCRTPYIKTREIFKFLYGGNSISSNDNYENENPVVQVSPELSPDPPKSVFTYIKSHIYIHLLSDSSPWSTKKNAFSHYQSWRDSITQKTLSIVEGTCQEALNLLGYRTFGTLENARNTSWPLFMGEKTYTIPYNDQNASEPYYE